MTNVHEDTHFDSAVSNIDSANFQKGNATGKVSQVLFLVLPVFQSYMRKSICRCEHYCFGPLLHFLRCCKQPEVTKRGKDVFLTFSCCWIPRMRLPSITGSGRSFLLSESLSGAVEIRATVLQPKQIRTQCTDCLMLKFCLTLHKLVELPYISKSQKENGRGWVKKEFTFYSSKIWMHPEVLLYLREFGWKFGQKFSKPTFLSE